jgi:hypothetical protein
MWPVLKWKNRLRMIPSEERRQAARLERAGQDSRSNSAADTARCEIPSMEGPT